MRRLVDGVFGTNLGRWALAGSLVLGLGLGAATVLRATALSPEPLPPAFLAAEEALAGPGVFGIFHLDVAFAVKTERELLGEEDREALLPPLSPDDTLSILWRESGIDPREALDQALMAISERDGEIGLATILLGRFPVEDLRQALPRAFDVSETEVGGKAAFLLSRVDPDSCAVSTPMLLQLTAERILLGTPLALEVLLPRLDQSAPAAVDLSEWRAFRERRLLSLVIMAPQQDPAKGVKNPYGRMAAEATREALEEVERFYAGVTVDAPGGFDLDARFHAKGEAWPQEVVADLTAWRESLTGKAAEDLPSLIRLQERLQLKAQGETLSAHLSLDKALIGDVAAFPADLIKLMFKGLGASPSGDAPAEPPAEELLSPDQLPQYQAQSGHDRLAAYDDSLDPGFRPPATSGPFGVKVREIRLKEDPEGPLLEIEVAAQSSEIPNMAADSMHGGSETAPAKLIVTAVRDAAGGDLMRAENCGRDRNPLPAALTPQTRSRFVNNNFVQAPIVAGTKAVRLKPGTRLADVVAIEGQISLSLPTRIETLRVTAPFAEKVVEDSHLRLKFAEAGSDSLTYELSGAGEAVLAVHGLNAEGAYLATAGSQSSGRLFGSGRSVTREFRGRPLAAEVVVARETNAQDYTFSLSPVRPRFQTWDRPAPYRVEAGGLAALESDFPSIQAQGLCDQGETLLPHPAFAVCIQDFEAGWGGRLTGQVVAAGPKSAALEGNLSAVELKIDRLQIAGAEGPVATDFATSQFLRLDGGQNEDYLSSSSNRYFSDPGSEALDGKEIQGLEGRLMVRLPTEMAALSLDVSEPGSQAEAPNGLKTGLLAITEGGLSVSISGPRDSLVQFIPYDASGRELATNAVRVERNDEGEGWSARMQTSGQPARLDIVYAAGSDLLELPLAFSWKE